VDCKQTREYLNDLVDDNLESGLKSEILAHLDKCDDCQKEFSAFQKIAEAASNLTPPSLPGGFHEALMGELRKEARPRRAFFKRNYKWVAGIAAALLVGVIVTAGFQNLYWQGFNGASMETMDEAVAEEPASAAPQEGFSEKSFDGGMAAAEAYGEDTGVTGVQGEEAPRKIIRNVTMEVETPDLEAAYKRLSDQVDLFGGFIENGNLGDYYYGYYEKIQEATWMRDAQITARIPSENLDDMIAFVEENSKVRTMRTSTQDQTEYYYDVDAQVENLKVREERLRELMEKAEAIEDILKVENELFRVRSEIDALQRNLKSIDSRVDFSTLFIQMREVEDSSAITLEDRSMAGEIREGFIRNINRIINLAQDAIVYGASALPVVIVIGFIGLAAYWIVKKIMHTVRR